MAQAEAFRQLVVARAGGACTLAAGRQLLGESMVQLVCGQFDGLIIGDELEDKAIAVNGDAQSRRAGGEAEQSAQAVVANCVLLAENPKVNLPALVGNQGRRGWITRNPRSFRATKQIRRPSYLLIQISSCPNSSLSRSFSAYQKRRSRRP